MCWSVSQALWAGRCSSGCGLAPSGVGPSDRHAFGSRWRNRNDAGATAAKQGVGMARQITPQLDLNEIQGDLLIGMQKNAELFIFYKIADTARFKALMREYVAGRVTNTWTAQQRDREVYENRRRGAARTEAW